MVERVLTGWTIHYNTADFPGKYVTRRWHVVRGSREPVNDLHPSYVGPDLAAARRIVPAGCYCLGRQPDDVPTILEVWV